jgi:hypothetical protein
MHEHLHVVVVSGHEGSLTEAADKLKRLPGYHRVSIGTDAPTHTPSQTWLVACPQTAKELRDHLREIEGFHVFVAELGGQWATHRGGATEAWIDFAFRGHERAIPSEALPADDETPPLPWWTRLARWLRA